jgi:3-hydroxyisobutyrate dehydrogenase
MAETDAPIGFVGLGAMGLHMTARLIQAGYTVIAWDISPTALAVAGGIGVIPADGPGDLARRCATVITALPGIDAVRAVALGAPGDEGLIDGWEPGAVLVDMGSASPDGTVELGRTLTASGIGYIDAPVSGGIARALTGELAVMAGGDAALVERMRPLLGVLGRQVIHTGPLGSGQAMKALNNLVSAGGLMIALEALTVGRRFGLDPATMVDVLNISTGRNYATEAKIKPFVLSRSFASGFSLNLMVKDLDTAADVARNLGIDLPLSHTVVELAHRAAEALGTGADHTAVARYLDAVAGSSQ